MSYYEDDHPIFPAIREIEDDLWSYEDEYYKICATPGRRGCGYCEACDDWADHEYDSIKNGDYDRPEDYY